MKNVQFGIMEDELSDKLDLLKVSLSMKIGKMVKNKELLEFMITAANEKIKGVEA